jgi:hypothetical protein
VAQSTPIPVVDLVIDDRADEQSDTSDLPDYVADPEPVDPDDNEDIVSDEAEDRSEAVASEFAMKEAVEAIEAATEILEMENLDADEAATEIADFYGNEESDASEDQR